MTHTDLTLNDSRKANRLILETSPYLIQHAYNPVDWYPWGPEALSRASAENKPILLSIGYAACHWCHVMEQESFEDEDTATLMNNHFVCIKVDREERPDLDEIYMKAVELMTGHGGWPMTVFLTEEGKPFFGGTYFPPEDRQGMPSFKRILMAVAHAWKTNHEKVIESSESMTHHLNLFNQIEQEGVACNRSLLEDSLKNLLTLIDPEWGGIGSQPKFPHCLSLEFAMRASSPSSPMDEDLRRRSLSFVSTTLDKMAIGGLHDQIGGGFARYTVDRQWLVPHFEKMLYDNALLSRVYLEGYRLLGQRYWANVAEHTLNFVLRELQSPHGAFFASLDADSQGQEGRYYLWTPGKVIEALGPDDGSWLNEVLGITQQGNFESGMSIAHLTDTPEVLAKRYNLSSEAFEARLSPLRDTLLRRRNQRPRPGRDEKILTSWNSLMISSLTLGYAVLRHEQYLAAARRAASFLLSRLYISGRLLHTFGQEQARLNAYLDDYAFLIQALLDLAAIDPESTWLSTAVELAESMLQHFADDCSGGFFFTSDDHEALITRSKSYFDGSTPSGTGQATQALIRLARILNHDRYRQTAEKTIGLYADHFRKSPAQFASLLSALDTQLSSQSEIVLATGAPESNWRQFLHAIHSCYLPHSVILIKDSKSASSVANPLLESREALGDKPTVYICRNHICQEPICDLSVVKERVKSLSEH